MNEEEVRSLLEQRLREVKFSVHREVSCRYTSGDTGRIDLHAVAPPSWETQFGYRTIGIEVKGCVDFAEGSINSLIQAREYMAAFCYHKEGRPLPRPDIFLIATYGALSNPLHDGGSMPSDGETHAAWRFGWRLGISFLFNAGGRIGFKAPAAGGGMPFITLFHSRAAS